MAVSRGFVYGRPRPNFRAFTFIFVEVVGWQFDISEELAYDLRMDKPLIFPTIFTTTVLCFTILFLTGCTESKSTRLEAKVLQDPVAQNNPWVKTLPPDPGRAGRNTLEGIDSNNNGVRDDIERAIVLNFYDRFDDKVMELAMFQARSLQRAILYSDSKEKSIEVSFEDSTGQALMCKEHVYGGTVNFSHFPAKEEDIRFDDYSEFNRIIQNQLANTRERSQRYTQYNRQLHGQVYEGISNEEQLQRARERFQEIKAKYDKEDGI